MFSETKCAGMCIGNFTAANGFSILPAYGFTKNHSINFIHCMNTQNAAMKTRTKPMSIEYWAIECRMYNGKTAFFNYLEMVETKMISFTPHLNACVFYSFADRMIAESYLVRNMERHHVHSYKFVKI